MKDCKNRKEDRVKSGNQRRIYLLPLIVVFIGICMTGGMLANYRTDLQKRSEITASNFHFTSDLLEENGASYTLTDWSEGFDIELYNYEKENTALISDENITYSVQLSDLNWACQDENNGTLQKDSDGKGKAQTIRIYPKSGAEEENAVTVTVESTAPFKKTLSATFTMAGSSTPSYTIKDQGDGTVLLTIKTNSYSGKMNVSWDRSKFDPDNTNTYMTEWKDSTGSGTLDTSSNTTYLLLFFKNTTDTVKEKSSSGTSISLSE